MAYGAAIDPECVIPCFVFEVASCPSSPSARAYNVKGTRPARRPAMALLGRPRQAWVWHAELPVQESSTSVNLRHMYEPIRSGVVAGLQSYLHAHPLQGRSWNITSRVCSESVMLINAWRSPSRARRVLERKLQSLRAGDLFVWIGHASQMAVPVSMLRSRGVHTVYYQLEPIESCTIYALTRRTGMDRYNEVWDYSPTNSQVCRDSQLHLNDTVFRYVPVVALPDRVQAAQQPSAWRRLGRARTVPRRCRLAVPHHLCVRSPC